MSKVTFGAILNVILGFFLYLVCTYDFKSRWNQETETIQKMLLMTFYNDALITHANKLFFKIILRRIPIFEKIFAIPEFPCELSVAEGGNSDRAWNRTRTCLQSYLNLDIPVFDPVANGKRRVKITKILGFNFFVSTVFISMLNLYGIFPKNGKLSRKPAGKKLQLNQGNKRALFSLKNLSESTFIVSIVALFNGILATVFFYLSCIHYLGSQHIEKEHLQKALLKAFHHDAVRKHANKHSFLNMLQRIQLFGKLFAIPKFPCVLPLAEGDNSAQAWNRTGSCLNSHFNLDIPVIDPVANGKGGDKRTKFLRLSFFAYIVFTSLLNIYRIHKANENISQEPVEEKRIQKKQRNTSVPFGLKNLGNTCYMNSAMQILIRMLKEHSFRMNDEQCKKGRILKHFKNIMECKKKSGSVVSMEVLKRVIGRLNPIYAGHDQQDAHEFMIDILKWLHEDLNQAKNIYMGHQPLSEDIADGAPDYVIANKYLKEIRQINDSLVTDLFQGLKKFTKNCSHCDTRSVRFETFNALTLNFPNDTDPCNMTDLFKNTFKQSILEDFTCEHCYTKGKVSRREELYRLPQYLVFHLGRFYFSLKTFNLAKINCPVSFPHLFMIQDFGEMGEAVQKSYELIGIINHRGTLNFGHYTALVKTADDLWYDCNDEYIKANPLIYKNKSSAYILTYKLKSLKKV